MQPFSVRGEREAQAWAAVAEVNDPELDEAVTDMGFVEKIDVADDGSVALDFRLPTYWCSPNFAFLMLDGVHKALERLAWEPRVHITLHDHLFAEEVNQGVAAGKRFDEIFAEHAAGEDLDALRLKFQMKAFQRRQEAALVQLREGGWPAREILALRRGELERPPEGLEATFTRYLQAWRWRFGDGAPEAPAFVDWDGTPVTVEGFSDHVARLRAVRVNMEFNGALCRGLKQVRYREKSREGPELTLVDFLPARAANWGVAARD